MNPLNEGSGAPTPGPSPEMQAVLAAELARLDSELFVAKIAELKIPPGGILAIIVPPGMSASSDEWLHAVDRIASAFDIQVVAFPHDTKLAVITEEQAPEPPPLPEPEVRSMYLSRGLGGDKAEYR